MSPLEFIKIPFAQVMGGVLAASLALNVFLFYNGQHQAEKKVECKQAVVVANKIATEKKVIIESRQETLTNEKEVALNRTIGSLRSKLQDVRSRLSDLSEPTPTTPRTVEEGRSALILRQDQLICSIAVDTARGWQDWYLGQVKIREEENAGTNP